MRYFMMLDEKKEYAEEVTKELQEEIGILHDENSMLHDENSMLQDKNSMLHDENSMLQDKLDKVAADSVRTIFEMCQEFQMDKDETIRRLEMKAHMSHQAAVDYVDEHWN